MTPENIRIESNEYNQYSIDIYGLKEKRHPFYNLNNSSRSTNFIEALRYAIKSANENKKKFIQYSKFPKQ